MSLYSTTRVQKEHGLLRVQQTPAPPFRLQSHFYYRSDFFVAAARADISTLLEAFAEEWPRRRDTGQAAVEWTEPDEPEDPREEPDEPVAGPSRATTIDVDGEEHQSEESEAPDAGKRKLRKRKATTQPAPRVNRKGQKPKFIAPAGLDSDVDENKLIDVKVQVRPLADYKNLMPDDGASAFAVFQDVWTRLGWSRVHLSTVDLINRVDWFDVLSRLMLERIDDHNLLRRAAAVFAVYTFWASQPDELEQRYIRIDGPTLDKLDATPEACTSALDGPLDPNEDGLLSSHDLQLAIEQLHRSAPITPAGRAKEGASGMSGFFLIPTALFNHPKLPSNYTIDGKERLRAKAAEQVLAAREELEAIIAGPRSSELQKLKRIYGVKKDVEPDENGDEMAVDEESRTTTTPTTAPTREVPKYRWEQLIKDVPSVVREDALKSREVALKTFLESAPLNEDILGRTKAKIAKGDSLGAISKVLDRQLDPQTEVSADGLPSAMRLLNDHDTLRDFLARDKGPDS